MIIGDQYNIQIALGGQLIPVSPHLVPSVHEINYTTGSVPTIVMLVKDVTGNMLNNYALGDGVPIDIATTRNTTQSATNTNTYRMLGNPRAASDIGQGIFKILGYWDAPKYLREVAAKPYSGNSNEAIQQIASDCGLTADTDPTVDTMTWLPHLVSYAQFAQHIKTHGWANANSLMHLALNRSSILMYKNMAELSKASPIATFTNGDGSTDTTGTIIKFADYVIKDKSGPLNHWMGYGATTSQTGTNGILSQFNQVNATLMSNDLSINTAVQGLVNSFVRSDYAPPAFGNQHQNFIQARHQNRRLGSLFACDIEIIIDADSSPVDLFSVVNLDLVDSSTYQSSQAYNGTYVVTAKTRAIHGIAYYEKLVLSSQGRGVQGLSPTDT